jgi:hypothetical protein
MEPVPRAIDPQPWPSPLAATISAPTAALEPPGLAFPVPQAPTLPLPPALGLVRAVLGFMLLGALAGAGSPSASVLLGIRASVVPVAGALLLTTPALLVTDQWRQGRASPTAKAAAVLRSFVGCGDIALALLPILLLFSLTTNRSAAVWALLDLALGALGIVLAVSRLAKVEASALKEPGDPTPQPGDATSGTLLHLAWGALTALIALQLALPLLSALTRP